MFQELTRLLGRKAAESTLFDELEAMGLPKPEIDSHENRKYFSFPSRGISLVFDDEDLTAIQLFAADAEPGFSAYRDDLPEGMLFSWGKARALKSLGVPDKSGGGAGSKIGPRSIPPWVRFHQGAYKLHLQFAPAEDRITRVSLMRPD